VVAVPESQAQGSSEPNKPDKQCSPNPVGVGQELTCTIDVTEGCPPNFFCFGVGIVDTFPAGARPIRARFHERGLSGRSGPCPVTGRTVTCSVAQPGGTVTIVATAERCGTFTNTATAGFQFAAKPGTDRERIAVVGCEGPVQEEVDQEAESGDVGLSFGVSNEGDYAEQCTPAQQFGQTGNAQDAPGALQYAGGVDDFGAGGIGFGAKPGSEAACNRTIGQSSSAFW
jgi:hypothetical protein